MPRGEALGCHSNTVTASSEAASGSAGLGRAAPAASALSSASPAPAAGLLRGVSQAVQVLLGPVPPFWSLPSA